MVPIFHYGNLTKTSCTSENLFKDLKTIVFKHKTLLLRLKNFLEIHINSILGSVNILNNKTRYEEKKTKNDKQFFTTNLCEINKDEPKLDNLKPSSEYQDDNNMRYTCTKAVKPLKKSNGSDKSDTKLEFNDNIFKNEENINVENNITVSKKLKFIKRFG